MEDLTHSDNAKDHKDRHGTLQSENESSHLKVMNYLTFYHTIPTFNNPRKKPFENIVGKGENAGNQYLLLFPQCFLPYQRQE